MAKLWKIFTALCTVGCFAFIAAAIVIGIKCIEARRGIDAEIAAIRAKGEPVAPEQLIHPPIPDSQNSAIILNQAFAKYPKKPTSAVLAFIRLHAPTPGAKDDLARYDGLAPLVERGLQRPQCDFRVDWSKGLVAEHPHYDKLARFAQVLAAMAIVEARGGNAHRAAKLIDDGLRLGELLKDEPVLIGQVIRYDIMSTMTDALAAVLCSCPLAPDDAARIDARLASIHPIPGWANAAVGQRTLGIAVFDEIFGRRYPTDFMDKPGSTQPAKRVTQQGRSMRLRPKLYARVTWTLDELQYLERMRSLVRSEGQPYAEHMRACPTDYDTYTGWARVAVVTCVLLPPWTSEPAHTASARIAAGRILLRVHAFRARHERYPSQLTELQTTDKWAAPADPYSGKPFIYRRHGNGFILYSIGPNMRDDGGRQLRSLRRAERLRDNYDITWTADK